MFCLGATKAGTSWLYRHLLAHPECRMRTIKELHYFSMTRPQHFQNAERGVAARMVQLTGRLAGADAPRRAVLQRQLADLADWRAVLAKGDIDLAAYRSFLTKDLGAARLVGDVTPAYALLPEDRLRGLADVGRDTRFVYLIRDPLARLWSHVRMIAQRTVPDDFADESAAILNRILSDDLSGEGQGIVARGNYAEVLAKLRAALPQDRLLVQFQEDMLTEAGLACLSDFLGLSQMPAPLEKRVFEGRSLPLPASLRVRALAWLRPQYEYVASLFPALPAAWRANMEEGFA